MNYYYVNIIAVLPYQLFLFKMTANQLYIEEIKRIRIKRIPTDQSLMTSPLGIYAGFTRFGSRDIANVIRDRLRVKPKASILVSYRNDPFDLSNTELFEKYGFVDFTGINNLEIVGLLERSALMRGETVNIVISPSETWLICIQDRNINLLRNSNRSETAHILSRNHPLNPSSSHHNDEYAIENAIIELRNPFAGNDNDEASLEYGDSYTTFDFE